ncbi:MAG: hypothetical protein FWE25_10190 [Lachnospiraceae bacterium]|nr:hypothetical protein [Lachnospiraceae bacterium]
MNIESIKTGMIAMYEDTHGERIHKKSYKQKIDALEHKYQGLLGEIKEALDESEGNIEAIADVLPGYIAGQLEEMASKRKRELYGVDHNMNMVAFFVPLIGLVQSEHTSALTDRIVELWNVKMPSSKIGVSTVENINGGFRKGLCYITTAVCHSLDKPDDCYELNLLRDYRDDYLLCFPEGRQVVEAYYNVAPTLVNRINAKADSDKIYQGIWLSHIRPCVKLIQEDKKEECKILYFNMVRMLEEKFL